MKKIMPTALGLGKLALSEHQNEQNKNNYELKFISWNIGDGTASDRKNPINDMITDHDILIFQESKWGLNTVKDHLKLPVSLQGSCKEIFQCSYNMILVNSNSIRITKEFVDMSKCYHIMRNSCSQAMFHGLLQRIQACHLFLADKNAEFVVFNVHMRRSSSKDDVIFCLKICTLYCRVNKISGMICGDFNLEGGFFQLEPLFDMPDEVRGLEWLVLNDPIRPQAPIDALFLVNSNCDLFGSDLIGRDFRMINLQDEETAREYQINLRERTTLNHPAITGTIIIY